MTLTANLIALGLYLLAFLYQGGCLLRARPIGLGLLRGLVLLAVLAHGVGIIGLLSSPAGYHFGLFNVLSLLFAVINAVVLLSSLRKPLEPLFLALTPLAAVAVVASLISHSPVILHGRIPAGIAAHVLLSILAYSLLTIATLQALFIGFQDRQLKAHHPTGLIRRLPPLQTMESLLFELLWAGMLLLTAAIVTGAAFLHDLLGQNLAHKTFFSLAAWLIYAVLLWGRHRLGWRGAVAIRFALGGFAALLLAYFGSKLVLEVILQRV